MKFTTTAAVAALSALAVRASDECTLDDVDKFDCGYSGIDEDGCEAKGCCWAESDSTDNVPWCFFPAGSVTTCFSVADSTDEPFSDSEVETMRGYFLDNINIEGKGGVVAAPDLDTPGGSYYYHWERDGALTMRCLQETSPSTVDVTSYMEAYTSWVLNVQSESDPNDIDVRTEPKYNLPDGDVYTGGWCRPQNDGPGLRAISLMIFAEAQLAAGNSDYVAANLWTTDGAGAIKYDLDYIVTDYDSNTCDLWEEVQSDDFFWNRLTMKQALLRGAEFATTMGDSTSAASYLETASKVNETLYSAHWNGQYVLESTNREKDGAVIVAFNDGFNDADGLFAPTSLEVASTIKTYNLAFCNEWAINTNDTDAGLPGVLYGRYPGDSYAGGNPWVLTTAALGNLFYRAAATILDGSADPSDGTEQWTVWADALNVDSVPTEAASAADLFFRAGDSVLLRLRAHVEADGFHLAEQIDRTTGLQISAEDLTWSYAEVLNAMTARAAYTAAAAATA